MPFSPAVPTPTLAPILVVDTAQHVLSLAILGKGGHVLASLQEEVWRDMAARFHPAVAQVLQAANITMQDLAALYVNVGPGSFTSIRIGLAAVKAFSFALGVPVYGASGLRAMAYPFLGKGQMVCPLFEATGGEVYAQFFTQTGTALCAPFSALPTEVVTIGQKTPEIAAGLPHCLFVGHTNFAVAGGLPSVLPVVPVIVAPPLGLQAAGEKGALHPLYVRPLAYKKQN